MSECGDGFKIGHQPPAVSFLFSLDLQLPPFFSATMIALASERAELVYLAKTFRVNFIAAVTSADKSQVNQLCHGDCRLTTNSLHMISCGCRQKTNQIRHTASALAPTRY